MFQNQQDFLTNMSCEIDRVALHALTVLISARCKAVPVTGPASAAAPALCLDEMNRRLYDAAISPDRNLVWATVRDMQGAGLCNKVIKSAFVPHVARQLGADWVADKASFAAVTIGCARLQAIVGRLEDDPPPVLHAGPYPSCLVVVPEGEQHTLGAVVLADQLRHRGAGPQLILGISVSGLAQCVRSRPFDMVMISASQGRPPADLRALVDSSRLQTHSPKVIIGGGILDQDVDLKAATGADFLSGDVHEVLDFCA